jgi:hypothetical protein
MNRVECPTRSPASFGHCVPVRSCGGDQLLEGGARNERLGEAPRRPVDRPDGLPSRDRVVCAREVSLSDARSSCPPKANARRTAFVRETHRLGINHELDRWGPQERDHNDKERPDEENHLRACYLRGTQPTGDDLPVESVPGPEDEDGDKRTERQPTGLAESEPSCRKVRSQIVARHEPILRLSRNR